jgi:hypothetical protein
MPGRLAWATGEESGWKHFTRQVPISGQTFWGQLGQGLVGLWHGISAAEVAAIGADMASAIDVVIGNAIRAPSMATMPSTMEQRWNRRLLTGRDCHTLLVLANDTSMALLTSELTVTYPKRLCLPKLVTG